METMGGWAVELSQKKVEQSWVAQAEARKAWETENAVAGSSKKAEEPPCWNCTEQEQDCIQEG